jgi:hypothetical protein
MQMDAISTGRVHLSRDAVAQPAALAPLLDTLIRSGRVVANQTAVLSKGDRAKIFLALLDAAHLTCPQHSKSGAFALINAAMNAVEDRYSGIAWRPGMIVDRNSERMLPITLDLYQGPVGAFRSELSGVDLIIRTADVYQTRRNHVLVADNGAFELWLSPSVAADGVTMKPGRCLLRVAGDDGRSITQPAHVTAQPPRSFLSSGSAPRPRALFSQTTLP